VLLAVGLVSCSTDRKPVDRTPLATTCAVTPTTSVTGSDGSTLLGLRSGDIFLYTIRAGPFYADPGEKFFVLLDRMPDNPNSLVLVVDAINHTSGSKLQVRASGLRAGFGYAWGAIYRFPDPGCWTLSVDQVGNRGAVTFLVEATCPPELRGSFCPSATASP